MFFLSLGVGKKVRSAKAESKTAALLLPSHFELQRMTVIVLWEQKINPGALETGSGHYFDRARSLPAISFHPGKRDRVAGCGLQVAGSQHGDIQDSDGTCLQEGLPANNQPRHSPD